MESHEFAELIESAGYEVRSYSGRGMFGKQCIGVSTDDVFELIANITKEIVDTDIEPVSRDSSTVRLNEWIELMTQIRTDSLGRGEIIYWPNMKWSADIQAVDDGEDDE